ncbi:hypothetical protein HanPSC8_Chr12g0520101 [Helianthus annuus]|nr:hypothetical protein HanPSC8_Chr12g0520101 [Helianthus annuus]
MNLVGKQSMMPLKASTTTANSQARVVRSKAQRVNYDNNDRQ